MKKIVVSLFLLVILSLFVPYIGDAPTQIHAATASPTPTISTYTTITTTTTTTKTISTTSKVEYVLPYPGILPTNPLYFLKSFRDWIIESLISDPIKKSEFYLLQADKKLGMALVLHDAKNSGEEARALKDALVLREKSLMVLESVRASKMIIPGFIVDKFLLSTQKHRELLSDLSQKTEGFEQLLVRGQALREEK